MELPVHVESANMLQQQLERIDGGLAKIKGSSSLASSYLTSSLVLVNLVWGQLGLDFGIFVLGGLVAVLAEKCDFPIAEMFA